LIAYTIASAVYAGSEIFGIQSGFNVSGALDPTVEESPITSELVYIMSLYVFVSLKGHILIYEAVIKSVENSRWYLQSCHLTNSTHNTLKSSWTCSFFRFNWHFPS